jgi:hypothetical protein
MLRNRLINCTIDAMPENTDYNHFPEVLSILPSNLSESLQLIQNENMQKCD